MMPLTLMFGNTKLNSTEYFTELNILVSTTTVVINLGSCLLDYYQTEYNSLFKSSYNKPSCYVTLLMLS